MFHVQLTEQISIEQRRDFLAAAERDRQAAVLAAPRDALTRRAATPIGRALVHVGARLLRYGRAEAPVVTRPYRASTRSIRMN